MATTCSKRNRDCVSGAAAQSVLFKNKQTKNFPESLGGVGCLRAETRFLDRSCQPREDVGREPKLAQKTVQKPEMARAFARSRVRNKGFLNTLNCGVQDLTLEGRARPGAWAVD